jgi:hypothetical protein
MLSMDKNFYPSLCWEIFVIAILSSAIVRTFSIKKRLRIILARHRMRFDEFNANPLTQVLVKYI